MGLGAALAGLALLTACGGQGPSSSPSPSPPPSPEPPAATGLRAFPGAEGGGAFAAGGRGRCSGGECSGRAIAVTTLADSGPGSLRACVDATGPRTCVFRVAGEIALESPLFVSAKNSELTIAGQTAPGGGVTLTGRRLRQTNWALLYVSDGAHDLVVRYLRLRKLLDPRCTSRLHGACAGLLHAYGPIRDVIFDHLSASWSIDDSVFNLVGSGRTERVTWSWVLAAESFRAGGRTQNTAGIIYGESPEGADAMVDLDIHHSVMTNVDHRLPIWAAGRFRHVCNLMHPYGDRATIVGGGSTAEFLNNFWKPGPGTSRAKIAELVLVVPEQRYANYPRANGGKPTLFLQGNRGPHAQPDDWGLTHETTDLNGWGRGGRGDRGYARPASRSFKGPRLPRLDAPISEHPVGLDGAALERLLWDDGVAPYGPAGASRRVDCAGRFVDARDAFDAGARARYRANSGFEPSSEEDPRYAATRSRWSDVRAAISAGTPCADADGDGIPDAYEREHGLEPKDPRDASRQAPDGYTWLEHWLNGS